MLNSKNELIQCTNI